MGLWGSRPWDNDAAADWFGSTMEKTKLAERVEKTLLMDVDEYPEEVRAAAAFVVLLAHPYVWPISDLDRHIELAASRLEALLESDFYEGSDEFMQPVREEIKLLRARLPGGDKTNQPDPVKWWRY